VISEQEIILNDINELDIVYQIKINLIEQENWQQYFHFFSLDSHQNNQLLLNFNQKVILSGLALSKNSQIKEINLVGEKFLFKAQLNCQSRKFSQKFPDIEDSSTARWQCHVEFNLIPSEHPELTLIVILDNAQTITLGQILFIPTKLNDCSLNQINSRLAHKINSIAKSRKLMVENIAKGRNYLFAIGNARSGTTALGELLNSSPEICLGIERYEKEYDLSAMSFQRKIFFDTNSKGYLVRPQLYESIKPKYNTAKYVGDKRPGFIQYWKNTFLNLPQAKVIYIFRNIYDVACSYNDRVNQASQGIKKSWKLTRDYSVAVSDWNNELNEIQNLVKFYEVYFIKYEDFFIDRSKMLSLFHYLQVNTEIQEVQEGIKKINQRALTLQQKERILTREEKNYIDSHADFPAYEQILKLYEQQSHQQGNNDCGKLSQLCI
jgi:hypothetical protein